MCRAALLPQLLLCGGRMSWRPHSCTVPKCHRGSCLPRKLGFAPCPQPASPVEYHRLTCEVCDLPGTGSRCGRAEPRNVSSARWGPSREQRSGMGRRALFQTMISLTGWSGTKITLRRSTSRNSLKPSVHYGTEPLFLRLASSLVFNPAPKAFWGTSPAKSRLFHPELDAEPDLGE